MAADGARRTSLFSAASIARGRSLSSTAIGGGPGLKCVDGSQKANGTTITMEDTFVDMFLKGVPSTITLSQDLETACVEELVASSTRQRLKTIPDPPGWDPTLLVRRSGSLMNIEEGLSEQACEDPDRAFAEQAANMSLQSMVQDYLKDHLAPQHMSSETPWLHEGSEWQTRFLTECGGGAGQEGDDAPRKFSVHVVVALRPVAPRSRPCAEEEAKRSLVLQPGECFLSQVRATMHGTRFVRRWPHGDWVFEHKGAERVLAAAEALELGPWWYHSVCPGLVEVRRVPTHGNAARTGYVLCPGETCVVSLRCFVDGRRYLLLADGRGWVFESAPSDDGEDEMLVMLECGAQLQKVPVSSDHRGALQTGCWMYQVLDQSILALGTSLFGHVLDPSEQVLVNARMPANGLARSWANEAAEEEEGVRVPFAERIWLRLQSGKGWIPNVDTKGAPLVRFVRGQDFVIEPTLSGRANSYVSSEASLNSWKKGIA